MTAALRYEWARVLTLRSTYWVIGLALVLHLLVGALIGWGLSGSETSISDSTAFEFLATAGASSGGPPLLTAYLLGVLGVLSFGHEYRHGLIRATLTAVPSRLAVLGAKLTVTGLLVAVAAAVTVLLAVPLQAAFGLGKVDWWTGVGQMLLAVVIYTVLFTWSGLGFAALFRNQTIAMLVLLFVPTVVEYVIRYVVIIIRALSDEPTREGGIAVILKYLPYDAGGQLYTRFDIAGGPIGYLAGEPFGAVGGGVFFAGFVAVIVGLGGWRFLRSDA